MAGKKILILVVDDDKIVCTALKRELGHEGYQADSAINCEEAIEKVKTKKYDLIFVDLLMPGKNGIETCKALKKINPDLALVFMTGIYQVLTDKEKKFVEAGGKGYYLSKPFGKNVIANIAKKALSERTKNGGAI